MKKLPTIINQEEFEKMFKFVLKTKKKNKKLFLIAMLLGFEAGMRISEILGLEINGNWKIKPLQAFQIENNSQIRLLGAKGGKDRVVPKPKRINANAIKLLPLTLKRRTLQDFITKLGRKVLNKRLTFHTLRAGFATHLINAGRPMHEVQMLMGHSNLNTTGIYLRASPKKAVEGAVDVF